MARKLSLADVLPRHERVDIGGGDQLDVFGISGGDIGRILLRYPDAFQQMMRSEGKPSLIDPGLLGALIAATQQRDGSDESMLGEDDIEMRASRLSAGAQVKIWQAMDRCTFPDGIGPFLASLRSMSASATEALEVIVQVASEEQAMTSHLMRRRSEQPQTPVSGNSHLDK